MDLNVSNEIISQAVHFETSDPNKVPADWTEQSIGQFCAVKTGPFGTLLKASEYSELDGVPVISVGEVREGYFRITEHTPLVPEVVQRRLPQYLLQAGDVVFGRKGAVERSALVREAQAGWFLGSDGIAVRPTGNHCPEYVAAQFQGFRVRQWLSLNSMGTTMASMNQSVLSRVSIPFPPTLAEEQSIAEALTDADALIDLLEQLLTKKRQIKQGAMQELLTGKRRLPGFSGKWLCDDLRALVQTPVTDGPHTTPIFVESGIPFLSVNNLVGNRIDLTDLRYITQEDDQLFARKCKPQRGDVLLGKAASVGKVAIVEDDLNFNIWSPIALIRVGAMLDSKFLFYQLQSQSVLTQIIVLTNSSSQGNIGMGDIERLRISYPSVEEQRQIAAVMSEMDAEIITIESRLTKARAIKQAMAQALLTGRVRLVKPNA